MNKSERVRDKSVLKSRFTQTRAQTEELCAPLNIEDYVPQAFEFASPPKWHLAHTSWFFEEMILVPSVAGYDRFDESFYRLFNSYYQTLGRPAERSQRGVITRPTVEQVYDYRHHVTEAIETLMDGMCSDDIFDLIELGINHEQQHQELLITDLKIAFSLNPNYPVYNREANFEHSGSIEEGCLDISAGLYDIGVPDSRFSFDNESGQHRVYLEDFSISKGLVSNAEWLEFIEAGGYQKFEYWLDEGWQWVQQNNIQAPLYWIPNGQSWCHFTLAGKVPFVPSAMVSHISYYEADAFANWKQARLPTEFEWEVAAPQFSWGHRWEWTSSAYQAYPGFKVGAGAVGEYNGKFMANQFVLRGASVATAKGHSRLSYRNFFHPYHQWQFSGLRLAK